MSEHICPLCDEPIDPRDRTVMASSRVERVNRGGYRIMRLEQRPAHWTCPVWRGKRAKSYDEEMAEMHQAMYEEFQTVEAPANGR